MGFFDKFKIGFQEKRICIYIWFKRNNRIKKEIDDKTLDQIEEYLNSDLM